MTTTFMHSFPLSVVGSCWSFKGRPNKQGVNRLPRAGETLRTFVTFAVIVGLSYPDKRRQAQPFFLIMSNSLNEPASRLISERRFFFV